MRAITTLAFLLAIMLGAPTPATSRPERIRPGIPYYSDDFVLAGEVYDLAEEKNLEEVYQLYLYYEAVYDESERVVTFKEYRRGQLVRTEAYSYGAGDRLVRKTVTRSGEPAEAISNEAPDRGRP